MARSTCCGCGLVFTGLTSFDMHRTGYFSKPIKGTNRYATHGRRCLSVQEMIEKGMVQSAKGVWMTGEIDTRFSRADRNKAPEAQIDEAG